MIFQKPLYMEVSKVFKSLLATLDTPSYTNIQKKTGRNRSARFVNSHHPRPAVMGKQRLNMHFHQFKGVQL